MPYMPVAVMGLTYFKRLRMEIDLSRYRPLLTPVPPAYHLMPWSPGLRAGHAEAKYLSFRSEIDADVFPCLGELAGCLQLMDEISRKDGFLPEETWLLEHRGLRRGRHAAARREFCGTVQGIRTDRRYGGIQNLGVTPEHRGQRLGRILMERALVGFQQVGLRRAYLEVTALNKPAVRLYKRMGFSKSKTLYKAVEVACT